MSKAIRSYPESKRDEVVARRIANRADGCGTLAALDCKDAKKRKEQEAAKKA
jgi:hypothetical protein